MVPWYCSYSFHVLVLLRCLVWFIGEQSLQEPCLRCFGGRTRDRNHAETALLYTLYSWWGRLHRPSRVSRFGLQVLVRRWACFPNKSMLHQSLSVQTFHGYFCNCPDYLSSFSRVSFFFFLFFQSLLPFFFSFVSLSRLLFSFFLLCFFFSFFWFPFLLKLLWPMHSILSYISIALLFWN